jgi:exonuclease III
MKKVRKTTKKYSSSKKPIYLAHKNAKESTNRSQKSLGNPKLIPQTLRIASWNVHGGFHDSEKKIQVGNAFFRSKLDLLFLQEAQGTFHNQPSLVPDEGWCYWHNSYDNEYSYGSNEDPDDNPQDLCMVASRALNRNIIKISHPYPRIMVTQIRLPLQISVPKTFTQHNRKKSLRQKHLCNVPSDFIFINVHAPTNPSTQEDPANSTEFYSRLREVLQQFASKRVFTMLLGDFNAKIGCDYPPSQHVGRYAIGQ